MLYTTHTNTDIEIIKAELESKAKEMGFGLLNTYEFKNILEEKGFPIDQEICVFEVCNPAGAQKALSYIPEISIYLPCRLSVYEENGGTTLSTIGLDEMVSVVEVDEAFKAFMNTLFTKLKKVMHSWGD